jgi:small subunit ribosomal protein S17
MADENTQDQDAGQEASSAAPSAAQDADTDAQAVEAAHDAERALETVQAEAASELPASDTTSITAAVRNEPTPKAEPETETDGRRLNRRKVREGIVVSDGMQATVVVAVVERVRHPKYGKTVQRTKKLYVHDAEDTAKVGDRVRVQETRPMSKLKRWRLTEVLERAR